MWYAKPTGGYSLTSAEAEANATAIYNVFSACGWQLPGIAGTLGNMQYESQLNPWIWQSNDILASTDPLIDTSSVHGYGLNQFTPAGTYIHGAAQSDPDYAPNFLDIAGEPEDGAAQCRWVDAYGGYIPTSDYPMTYAEYKSETEETPENMAEIWLYNYGRGGSGVEQTLPARKEYARYWYDFLSGSISRKIFLIKKKIIR